MWPPTKLGNHGALGLVSGLGSDAQVHVSGIECKEIDVAVSLPDAASRWRCGGCGNLTRFDVTRTRRTNEFWHFDLAGTHQIEDSETQSEQLESVTCRWCGRSDSIEVVSRAEAGTTTS